MPGGAPYITPAMLLARPAGISWQSVPALSANAAQQQAQLLQECWAATSAVDRYCRQPMRAMISTETAVGPGQPRISVDRCTLVGTIITRRWPVVSVAAIQVAPAPPYGSFPPAWTLVTAGAQPAGTYNIRNPVITSTTAAPATGPSGGNVIDVAPGWIDWYYGRSGWNVMTSYQSGWPHCSLTQAQAVGDVALHVDDVTGWPGQVGFVYDAASTEAVQPSAAAATSPAVLPGVGGTVQAGPGTITIPTPGLQFAHPAGTVISAMPADFLRAVALQATVQALETIDAIATQSLSGQFAGGTGVLAESVELILDEYRRVI